MAGVQDLIAAAKEEGWSDPQIASFIYSKYPKLMTTAREQGYKDQETFSKVFGLDLTPPKDLNIDQLSLDAYNKHIKDKYPNVPPSLLRGLFKHESSDNPYALGSVLDETGSHAKGLGQLTPATAKALGVTDEFDPAQNVDASARRLLEALDRQKGNPDLALMDYHGGPSWDKWGPRTRAYPGLVQKAQASLTSPTAAPAAQPGSLEELEATTQAALVPPAPPQARAAEPPVYPAAPWNALDATANGASLGFFPRMAAVLTAGKGAAQDIYNSETEPWSMDRLKAMKDAVQSAFGAPAEENDFTRYGGNYYRQAKTAIEASRRNYADANPLTSAGLETLGSLPPTIAATLLGGAGVNALAPKAIAALPARVAPVAQGTLDFLSGESGQGPGVVNWLTRRASQSAAGGVAGTTAAAVTSGLSDMPLEDQMQMGALIGELGGLASPAVQRLMSTLPPKVSQQIAQLADRAEELGVNLKTSNVFKPSKTARTPSQIKELSDAVAKTFGAPDLTPEGMAAAKSTLQRGFNQVASKTGWINLDPKVFGAELNTIERDAMRGLREDELTPFLRNLEDLRVEMRTGGISGGAYQNYTKSDSPLRRLAANGNTYALKTVKALEDALQASAPAGLQEELTALRKQWSNMMAVKPAVAKNASGDGLVDPKALFAAIKSHDPNFAFKMGDDLNDLGRIAGTFLSKAPADKNWVQRHILPKLGTWGATGATAVGTLGVEQLVQHDPETALKIAALLGGTKLAQVLGGRAMNSKVVMNALIDHSLGVPGVNKLTPAATTMSNELGVPVPFKGLGR